MDTHQGGCTSVVHQEVQVEAVVTVTPSVKIGKGLQVECTGPLRYRKGHDKKSCPPSSCSFTVQQNLHLRIPLVFKAQASAAHGGTVCKVPELEPCETNTDL